MAELDPNIILSGQDPMVQQQRALQLNSLRMQATQDAQAQKDAMALRQIFQQPGALDPKTGEPTGQTLNQIMRVAPKAGMDIQKSVLAAQKQRVDLSSSQIQATIDKGDLIDKLIRTPALARYDSAKEAGFSELAARDVAQSTMSEGLAEAEKTGPFSDEEKAKFPRKFDPDQMRAIDQQYTMKRVELLDKKRARDLEEKRVGYEGDRVGMERKRVELEREKFNLEKQGMQLTPDAFDDAAKTYISTGRTPANATPAQASQIANRASELRKQGYSGAKELKDAQLIEYEDPKDGSQKSAYLQQDKATGQWFTADQERKAVEVKNPRPIKEGSASGREEVMIQRQLNNAKTIVSELQNVVELPQGASTGILGGYHPGTSLLGATRGVLGRVVTSQEVQDMNVSTVGLGRALAGLETGGLQVNQGLMSQFEGLQLKAGDTQLTKMRKLATMRQDAENSLETALSNPHMGKKQVEFINEMMANLKKAIPWSPHDVTALEALNDPKATLGDFAKAKGLDKDKPGTATAPIAPKADAGGGAAPPVSMLKEGVATHFDNGQTWTLKKGVPQLVEAGGVKVP